MTNKKLIALYEKFLRDCCHCCPDEIGNRPCDNGAMCDRCMTKQAQEIWKMMKEV